MSIFLTMKNSFRYIIFDQYSDKNRYLIRRYIVSPIIYKSRNTIFKNIKIW